MKNLFLYGLPFSGKSTVGNLLAKALKKKFLDTDKELEKKHRIPCRELFRTLGEKKFRELEREILKSLGPPGVSIVALGGGTLTDPVNLEIARKKGVLLYLKCEGAELKKRMASQNGKPAYLDDCTFDALEKKRRLLYESIADYVADTAKGPPEQIVHHIGEIIGQ